MKQPRSKDSIVRELLLASEEALKAAKIEHQAAYQAAMEKRGKLLCALWGFPEGTSLPEFDQQLVNKQRQHLPRIGKADLARIRELDQGILQALSAQKKRVLEDEARVTRGRRFMQGFRTLGSGKTGSRLDRSG